MKSMKDRDSRLYKFWLEHPAMSFQKIGNVFHIKYRQQVFVIIKREKELAGALNIGRPAPSATGQKVCPEALLTGSKSEPASRE